MFSYVDFALCICRLFSFLTNIILLGLFNVSNCCYCGVTSFRLTASSHGNMYMHAGGLWFYASSRCLLWHSRIKIFTLTQQDQLPLNSSFCVTFWLLTLTNYAMCPLSYCWRFMLCKLGVSSIDMGSMQKPCSLLQIFTHLALSRFFNDSPTESKKEPSVFPNYLATVKQNFTICVNASVEHWYKSRKMQSKSCIVNATESGPRVQQRPIVIVYNWNFPFSLWFRWYGEMLWQMSTYYVWCTLRWMCMKLWLQNWVKRLYEPCSFQVVVTIPRS